MTKKGEWTWKYRSWDVWDFLLVSFDSGSVGVTVEEGPEREGPQKEGPDEGGPEGDVQGTKGREWSVGERKTKNLRQWNDIEVSTFQINNDME